MNCCYGMFRYWRCIRRWRGGFTVNPHQIFQNVDSSANSAFRQYGVTRLIWHTYSVFQKSNSFDFRSILLRMLTDFHIFTAWRYASEVCCRRVSMCVCLCVSVTRRFIPKWRNAGSRKERISHDSSRTLVFRGQRSRRNSNRVTLKKVLNAGDFRRLSIGDSLITIIRQGALLLQRDRARRLLVEILSPVGQIYTKHPIWKKTSNRRMTFKYTQGQHNRCY